MYNVQCTMSSKFRVSNGVSQGGVLSPLLCNVYVNDIPKRVYLASII